MDLEAGRLVWRRRFAGPSGASRATHDSLAAVGLVEHAPSMDHQRLTEADWIRLDEAGI